MESSIFTRWLRRPLIGAAMLAAGTVAVAGTTTSAQAQYYGYYPYYPYYSPYCNPYYYPYGCAPAYPYYYGPPGVAWGWHGHHRGYHGYRGHHGGHRGGHHGRGHHH